MNRRFERRGQAERDGGGVAAGVAEQTGVFDLLPVQLRQGVYGFLMQGGVRVAKAVPIAVILLIVQAEICA